MVVIIRLEILFEQVHELRVDSYNVTLTMHERFVSM